MDDIIYSSGRETKIGTCLLISAAVISLSFAQGIQTSGIPSGTMINPNEIRQEYGVSAGILPEDTEYNSTTLQNKEGVTMTDEKMKNIEKLNSFLKLPFNWNGYGAKPISPSLISKMKGLVLVLDYQPDIFPTARNSIQFEYEKEDGSYLEFELFDNDSIQTFSINGAGKEQNANISFDYSIINRMVESFYEC